MPGEAKMRERYNANQKGRAGKVLYVPFLIKEIRR